MTMTERLVLIMMILYGGVMAANNQELFLEGNQLYECGAYQKALDKYSVITDKGPAAWYNMGLCYYALQKYGHAQACWQSAHRGSTWSERTLFAQALAYAQAHGDNLPRTTFVQWLSSWALRVASLLPMVVWQLLVIMSWFCLIMGWYYVRRHYGWLWCMIVVFLLLSSMMLFLHYREYKKCVVVPCDDECVMFAGPDSKYQRVTALPTCSALEMLALQGAWCKVQHGQMIGWVPHDKLLW